MGFFIFKVIISSLIISFASWLSLKRPSLAGFIISLPIVSLITVALSYYEHKNLEKTTILAKSIIVGVPISLMFFVPFFFAKIFEMNFISTYALGIFFLLIGYFVHKFITSFF